ncbi:MAG: hypothetical protein IPN19_07075 [Elusimicrobia bacterium]|nr:hypothetical protein [Elusimicrobiota bacterium]
MPLTGLRPLLSPYCDRGYHGPGLKEKLTQAGIAVVTVVPKIEKIDTAQGSSYLTVFAQEKTPLDKLFEGAKLFVADAPFTADHGRTSGDWRGAQFTNTWRLSNTKSIGVLGNAL